MADVVVSREFQQYFLDVLAEIRNRTLIKEGYTIKFTMKPEEETNAAKQRTVCPDRAGAPAID